MPATKTPSNAATAEGPYRVVKVETGDADWYEIRTSDGRAYATLSCEDFSREDAEDRASCMSVAHAAGRAAQLRELLPVLRDALILITSAGERGCDMGVTGKLQRIIADAEAK